MKTIYSEGITSLQSSQNVKNTRFNIINLEVSHKNFENALEHWKKYNIEEYLTEKVIYNFIQGNKVTASVENAFLETPALMAFLINRVIYKDNKL